MVQGVLQTQTESDRTMQGKYLTFALGREEFGLEILKVREIMGYMDITAVPQAAGHVRGVINLRGKVIPIIDLRARFGMEPVERTEETCIIVVEIQRGQGTVSTGIIVDRVSEVIHVGADQIEPPPVIGLMTRTDYILGMGKINKSVKLLLDIDKVLMDQGLETMLEETGD